MDDLREHGDIRIQNGYYDRIIRTAAFELQVSGSCTYGRAVSAVRGLILMLERWGFHTGGINIHIGEPRLIIGHMELIAWPPQERQTHLSSF